jgi:GNAT superfamily N-acetyltransferase
VSPSAVVSIRRALVGEAAVVASVLGEAAEWLRRRGDPLWDASEVAAESIQAEVNAGDYVLAFVADQAAGTARVTSEDTLHWPEAAAGEALYLHRLAVRRFYAGGPVSKAIVEWALSSAAALGCRFLRLDCEASRQRLRALYESMGFALVDERVVAAHTAARFQRALP